MTSPITRADLWQAAREAARRFDDEPPFVFGSIGLNLAEDFPAYDCTPRNTKTFANTGVDGCHWGLLVMADRPEHDWPVVFTSPMDFSSQHAIGGESLRDFIELGCASRNFDGIGHGESHDVDSNDAPLWEFLKDHFHLRDRSDIDAWMDMLQTRYLEMLDIPDE